MCMLCGETAAQGRRESFALAEKLERLATHQKGLASGRVKPHGEASKTAGYLAASIIRDLVAEYV